jgi:hypothetical protein
MDSFRLEIAGQGDLQGLLFTGIILTVNRYTLVQAIRRDANSFNAPTGFGLHVSALDYIAGRANGLAPVG